MTNKHTQYNPITQIKSRKRQKSVEKKEIVDVYTLLYLKVLIDLFISIGNHSLVKFRFHVNETELT